MECDPHLFSRIKDPWKNKLRSLLVENPSDYNQWKCGDSALFYGIAGQWKDERQIFEMYNLIPFKGLSLSPNPIVGLIERDEQCSSVSIPAGAMFGVADAVVQSVSPLQLKITDDSKLWYISDVDRHFPINFCHHFCGSFGGWGRACEWLASSKDFCTKSVISVDAAYDVMKIWSLQNNSSFLEQHIPCSHVDSAQHVGALMPIQNLAWTNLCRYQCNMVCTFSPPCQPWSLGGVGMGFESDNGMSMGSAIYAIRIVRPIIALFECADTVPGHPHYKLIRYGLAFAGYTMVWTSISTYHELSAMQRSRWLSIWVRNDIKSFEITGDFKMSVPGKMPWNHAMYSFFLPFALRQQLLLDDQLRGIYGDVRFLPKNRKSCLSVGVGCEGVLQARVLPEKSQMPTLCASYTQQRLLSEDHLLKKGIFAPLAKIGEDFLFIDPFRFISLLGMPCDQTIFCDCDTEVIFRHIGNAISVPHALVSILIALTSVGFTRIPIVRSVVECWNARTMRVYAVVLVARDFFIITPKDKAKFFFHHCGLSQSKGDICLSFTDVDGTWFVPSETTIESFLSLCGFENIVDQGIQCAINRVVVHPSTTIGSLQGFDVDIEWFSRWINPDAECIASFQIHMQHTQEWTPPPIVAGSQSGEHENVHEVLRDDPPNEPVLSGCEVFPCFLFFTPTGEKIECFLPQHVTADDLFDVLQFEIEFKGSTNFQWGECPFLCDGKRIFIVDPDSPFQPELRFAVVLSNGSPFTILSIDATIYPGNLAYLNGYFPTEVKVNGIGTDLFDHCPIENGHSIDFISDHPTARKTDLENAWKIRHEFIHVTAERVASDELEFAVQQIRDFSSDVYCAKIIDARAKRIDSSAAILQQSLSGIPHIAISEQIECLIPIFLENHWCGIELSCCNNVWKIVLVGVPQAFHESFLWITRGAVSFPGATIHAFVAPVVSFPGLCGWVIVKRWFQKVGLLDSFVSRFGHVETTDLIVGPFESTFRANGGCQTVKRICSFAIICRSAFFAFLATKDSANLIDMRIPLFGGADEDEQMQEVVPPKSKAVQSNSSDPWSRFDPWMSRSQKQCKWEDLKLARDHPFVDKDGRSLGQVHKQQLNANTGGIAFATRAAAADLVKVIPSEPAAILVPASDKPLHPSINASQVSGPFEVVVEDASTGSIYKRQTILIQIKPFVKYQLASPVYNAKLDLIKEVVLEIDSRLYKGPFDRPLDVFKRLIDDQFPHEVFQGVNIYGYRKFQPTANDQGHIVHQVMCKLPLPKRSAAIERSLLGSIAVRDFIPKGERCDETSVVPKFWPVDKASRDAALKATSGLEGFAGLIVSKRGLAVRCWAGKIGILRKALLPEDDRLCEININVVPKIVKDSTGWPLAISPGEVIKATFHAVKLAPVPTRCFRVLGVTCWQLSFEEEPQCSKFVVKFNTELHEILLANPGTQINPKQQKKQDKIDKPAARSQSSNLNSQAVIVNDDVADRVSILEAKFQTFEKRKDKVEAQLQNGFENIHSQLRQVLNAVSQSREKTPTGETPPPKFPKTY